MAEQQKSKSEKSAEPKTTHAENPTTPLDAGGFQAAVNEALKTYVHGVRDAYSNGQRKTADLYQEYVKAQNEQQILAYDNLKEDYRNYVGTLREAWGQENAQARLEEVNRNYTNVLSDRQVEIGKSLESLYANFVDTQQKNSIQAQDNCRQEFQNFLRAVQTAWQRVDIATVDANTLASLGQVLITASYYLNNTVAAKQ